MSKGKTFICLRNLIGFFSRTKGVGHTTTMLNGIRNATKPTTVIVITTEHGRALAKECNNPNLTFLPMNKLMARDGLAGSGTPIAFDPEVVNLIVQKYESRIELLCRQNAEWKRRTTAASQLLNGQWPRNCQDDEDSA